MVTDWFRVKYPTDSTPTPQLLTSSAITSRRVTWFHCFAFTTQSNDITADYHTALPLDMFLHFNERRAAP